MVITRRWNWCKQHWIVVIGTFYILIILSTFYLVAISKISKDNDNEVELVTSDKVECTTVCNCTHFDMPLPSSSREPSVECPRIPPNLVGHLKVTCNTTADAVHNQTALEGLTPGGFYRPSDCKAREKVAIIIPYRNRASHLEILLYHLHTFLQKQQRNYAIFVIEVALPTQFNRGLLANVGFLTALTVSNFTCVIIHDVDLLPANDHNLYQCSSGHPRHLLPYGHYIGGIVAFTTEQFKTINGFSNAFFGWGKEDDDLYKRILLKGYKIQRPPDDVGLYEALPHTLDHTNPDNVMKDSLLLYGDRRSKRDGLNSVIYTRLALEFRPLYTWVYIRVNETLVMQLYQGNQCMYALLVFLYPVNCAVLFPSHWLLSLVLTVDTIISSERGMNPFVITLINPLKEMGQAGDLSDLLVLGHNSLPDEQNFRCQN